MCRICGIVNPGEINGKEMLKKMNSSMHHGGPDDNGISNSDKVLLGHNRLSIIDLSDHSHQPMEINDVVLTYNGEIYNFGEIKSELINKGHHFNSTGDTEVIIKAYFEWGEKSFEMFNGMFAFGLFDQRQNLFYLVRDASGIKPLYYSIKGNTLFFASEMRAFYQTDLFSDNENWKTLFLAFGHLPAPATTLKEVKIFPKGKFLKWNINNSQYTFHSFSKFMFTSEINSFSQAVEIIREQLKSAVERHLISDAPIGVFLSGGLDSSLLTLLAAQTQKENLKTLSIYFNEKEYSEFNFQKIISEKIPGEHISVKISKDDLAQEFEDIFLAMDQPTTDGINSYFISSVAHKQGLKAVLSGIGADELFGGYPSFSRMKWINNSRFIPVSVLSIAANLRSDKIKKIDYLRKRDLIGDYLFMRGFFPISEISKLTVNNENSVWDLICEFSLNDEPGKLDGGNKASWLESNYYMQNQLLKDTDMMSMWHSLEVRVPFLDRNLVKTMYSIYPEIKFNSVPKHLLIEAFKDILPEEIYNRPKRGFTFPFQNWLRELNILTELENKDDLSKKYFDKFKRGDLHWSRIWALYVMHHWQEKRMKVELN
ncbi:MAG: asparagine synthase (glutamine-hydrolyzing) [Bacteroidia bacterium]